MQIREFRIKDNDEYSSWFKDYNLNSALGPAWNKKELEQMLNSTDGDEFVGIEDGKIVGVVGVVFPDDDHQQYVITGIAVHPSLRGQGIGRRMLKKVLNRYKLKSGESWITYIDENNLRAKQFFESLGWEVLSEPFENNNMSCLGIK